MAKTNFLLVLLIVSFLTFSCKNSNKEKSEKVDCEQIERTNSDKQGKEEIKEAEDFDEFYNKFITDANFQKERLKFPIRGGVHEEEGTTEWTKENWEIMNQHIDNIDKNEYNVEIIREETKVNHVVELPFSGFAIDITFEILEGKWFLTEYNRYNF